MASAALAKLQARLREASFEGELASVKRIVDGACIQPNGTKEDRGVLGPSSPGMACRN